MQIATPDVAIPDPTSDTPDTRFEPPVILIAVIPSVFIYMRLLVFPRGPPNEDNHWLLPVIFIGPLIFTSDAITTFSLFDSAKLISVWSSVPSVL
jgi:hypothetical protein